MPSAHPRRAGKKTPVPATKSIRPLAEEARNSADIFTDNIARLKTLFPELITESEGGVSVNVDVLKGLVGDRTVTDGEEKYGLSWHGKRRARQLALTPSNGALRPCPDESVEWDTTQNLMIEGDNLEILKLLQKSYAGKVKLIYIDPPYNTGKDFVYPDNFQDNIKNYLELTGQVEGGNKISSNTEASGRFHTDWLNMMYPRLKLARNLLRDDGFIFISIDEGEVENLRCACNEIFGEECFVGIITWEKRTKAQNTMTARDQFQSKTEFILAYQKSAAAARFNLVTVGEKEYPETDERGLYRTKLVEEMSARGMRGRLTMIFPIKGVMPREGKQWKVGREQLRRYEERGDVFLRAGRVFLRIRPGDEISERVLPFWSHFFAKDSHGTAETGKAELSEVLGLATHGFETVKPVSLIRKLLFHVQASDKDALENDIVLDFFAGSGTTGHAVMEQNSEDLVNRRFVLVQLPELTNGESPYSTISELTKERLRLAAKKIKHENPMFAGDLGFRVFKLDSTNIRAWEPDGENLERTLLDSVDHLKADRTEQDILYELLLKLGLDLAVAIETKKIAGHEVHSIGAGALVVCLATKIPAKDIEPLALGIAEWHKAQNPAGESTVVFRDSAFADDVAKTNLTAILEQHGLENVRSI